MRLTAWFLELRLVLQQTKNTETFRTRLFLNLGAKV